MGRTASPFLGVVLRRLVAKVAARKIMTKVVDLLSPHQLGVGVRGGAESIIHGVNLCLQSDPSIMVLQADIQNAFNTVKRDYLLMEVADKIPELLAFTSVCYGGPSHLIFGDHVLQSSVGLQQGDPMSPTIFGIVLLPVCLRIQQEVPSVRLNAWYLDDSHILGRKQELVQALQIIKREGEPRGLFLSTDLTGGGKTTVWSQEPTDF